MLGRPGALSPARWKRRKILSQRAFHDFVRGTTQGGTFKIPLKSQKVVGVATSRGTREYQEDATSVHTLSLAPIDLQYTLSRLKPPVPFDIPAPPPPPADPGSGLLGQVSFFGIYDGHGGKDVSAYLRDHLHALIENVDPRNIEKLVDWTRERHGGYYKRWRGGALGRWTRWSHALPPEEGAGISLEERLTLASLSADKEILSTIEKSQRCGSTATLALLHCLDDPTQPYFSAKKLSLTMAQCGDTRAVLCHRETGEVIALTEKHHAEARVEASRLRRMGANRLVADSFGESRWMGVVENTRGFGDGEWKSSGVTAEPEVNTRVIDGEDHCYLILLTDGLTSLMSDQEIVDLARHAIDPTRAAKAIVHFGEDLGAQDNCTCIVIPLAGWGKVGGIDRTEERREYRRRQAGMLNTRMQRM